MLLNLKLEKSSNDIYWYAGLNNKAYSHEVTWMNHSYYYINNIRHGYANIDDIIMFVNKGYRQGAYLDKYKNKINMLAYMLNNKASK